MLVTMVVVVGKSESKMGMMRIVQGEVHGARGAEAWIYFE